MGCWKQIGLAVALAASLLTAAEDPQNLLKEGLEAYQDRDFQLALEKWTAGLALAESQQDDLFIGSFHGNLGIIHSVLGDYEKAARHLEQSIAMARESGDRQGLKNRLNSLGGLYLRLKQPDLALERLNEALPITRDLSDYRIEATVLTNIGEAHRMAGKNREAAESLREALAVAGDHELAELEVNILSNLGIVYLAMGNYPQALSHLRRSITTVQKAPDSRPKSVVLIRDYNRMGQVLLELGDPVAAAGFYNSAIEQAAAEQLTKLQTDSEQHLLRAQLEIGDGAPERLTRMRVEGLLQMADRLRRHGFPVMAEQVSSQASKLSTSGGSTTAHPEPPRALP